MKSRNICNWKEYSLINIRIFQISTYEIINNKLFRRSNVVLRRNDYSDTDNVIIIVLFKSLILIINNFLSLIFLTCLLLNVQLYFNMYICINLIVFEEIDKSVKFRLLSKLQSKLHLSISETQLHYILQTNLCCESNCSRVRWFRLKVCTSPFYY